MSKQIIPLNVDYSSKIEGKVTSEKFLKIRDI